MTRVVALGAAGAGDDGVGLAVLEELARRGPPAGVELHALGDPSRLVDHVRTARRLIVLDALVGDLPCGAIRVVGPEQLATDALSSLSSHGVSVGQALALARALDPQHAAEVHVVGIGIEPPHGPALSLSPAARRAVPAAVETVLRLLGE